jgi:hypothetical protein
MKYLILVLSCTSPPFNDIEQGQQETWASVESPKDLGVVFYYANPHKETHWVGDRVFVQTTESDDNIVKSLMALEEALKTYTDVTHVFFTNASSYIVKDRILDVFKSLPMTQVYSGVNGTIARYNQTFNFASGSGFFMSRDLCEDILKNRQDIPERASGDVEFGYYFFKKGILPRPQPRLDLCQWAMSQVMATLSKEHLNNHFHIRCKQWNNRDNDRKVMNRVHQILLDKVTL